MHTSKHHAAPALGSSKLKLDDKTLGTLADLNSIDCRIEEIAANFMVTVGALQEFLRNNPAARAALKRGHEDGTERLRQACARHANGEAKARDHAGKKPSKRQSQKSQQRPTAA